MSERYENTTMATLKEQLESKREELAGVRSELGESRERLGQRESEPQERAQAESRAQRLHSEDETTRQELWEVDAALTRMELGNYGLCTGCGKTITENRLKAVPWTRYCLDCAQQGAQHSHEKAMEDVGPAAGSFAPLPEAFQGLQGEQFTSAVLERLEQDGRLPLQELEPQLEHGRLVLQGAVPSETDRQLLVQVMQDRLGFSDFLDLVRVDPMLFKREQHEQQGRQRSEDEELLEGEGAQEDMQRAREEGGSIVPPDRFVDPRES